MTGSRGKWVIAALCAAAAAHALLDARTGVRPWLSLRAELDERRGNIETLRAGVAGLEREAQALEREPFAVERAIREQLGLAREGETLLRLADGSLSSARNP